MKLALIACIALLTLPARALTITSGPTLTSSIVTPLAGRLEVQTDEYSSLSVTVSDGLETWQKRFFTYESQHAVPLLGFKPGRSYAVTVTLRNISGDTRTSTVQFVTAALPSGFPRITLLESHPEKMEPGYTLFRNYYYQNARSYVIIVNNQAEVVWYSTIPAGGEVRWLPEKGHMFIPFPTRFDEVNLYGEVVRSLALPVGLDYHHEAFPTDHGTYLYLSHGTRMVDDFPVSLDPSALRQTTRIWVNPVVELDAATGLVVNEWDPLDMLDPLRLTYLTFSIRGPRGIEWTHANAVIPDPRDDSVIVSLRHQNAVIKFSRATGQLKWILGSHEGWGPEFQPYLLTPVGAPFGWNYAEHAPMITPQGTLLLFDNGNFRATPPDSWMADSNNYSRAVEFSINEETMEVSQVWEYGANIQPRMYSPSVSDANALRKSGNVLVTFGNVRYMNGLSPSPVAPNSAMPRIIEVTHDAVPEKVFDMAVFDFANTSTNFRGSLVYRSERIPDLYAVETPADRLTALLAWVSDQDLGSGNSLAASLQSAANSVNRSDSTPAVNQLFAFQLKAMAQYARKDPGLAHELIHRAQAIIDQIEAEGAGEL